MNRPVSSQENCALYRETIQSTWLDHASTDDLALRAHLESCPECSELADDLARWDRTLNASMNTLLRSVRPPSEERLEATVRRALEEEDPEAQLLRRLRRPLRTVLWVTLYALSLLGACALVATVYRALQELGAR